MSTPTRLIVLLAPLALAACGSQADDTQRTDTSMTTDMPMGDQAAMADGTPMMQAGEAGKIGSTQGTVTKVDDAAGTITIDHGPVPAVEWPAMTMGFSADEAQRASVAVGDKVTFSFRKTEQGGEIVALSKN